MNHSFGGGNSIRIPEVTLPTGGLDIWWVPLPAIDYKTLLAAYSECLSAEEHLRLQARRLPKSQLQFVFTRVVLRHLLSAYHPDVSPELWRIDRAESGRPHLSREQTPLSFNLTHTDDCLVFAFSQYADPGVDIELLSRTMEIDAVAGRYFAKQECDEMRQLPEAEQQEFFYRLWTLKEAAVKASGLGLAKGLSRFQFCQPGGSLFTHDVAGSGLESADFKFWSSCFCAHVAALALMSRQGINLPDIKPVSRNFIWPDDVSDISPVWTESRCAVSEQKLKHKL